jgi:hypothetical protein
VEEVMDREEREGEVGRTGDGGGGGKSRSEEEEVMEEGRER